MARESKLLRFFRMCHIRSVGSWTRGKNVECSYSLCMCTSYAMQKLYTVWWSSLQHVSHSGAFYLVPRRNSAHPGFQIAWCSRKESDEVQNSTVVLMSFMAGILTRLERADLKCGLWRPTSGWSIGLSWVKSVRTGREILYAIGFSRRIRHGQ